MKSKFLRFRDLCISIAQDKSKIFSNLFNEIEHSCPTRYSKRNYKRPKPKTKTTSSAAIWKKYLNENEKFIFPMSFFLSIVKRKSETKDEKNFCYVLLLLYR